MQLSYATWPEVERYLAARQDILIPIGATEQHGPCGPIGTDWICAWGVARETGAREELLVAPPLQVGMSLHHLAFPGSISLRPQTMMAVLEDLAHSLAGHGFTQLHFVNGHGGNVASTGAAFSAIMARHPQLRCLLTSWYELEPIQELIEARFGDRDGSHATPSELSLAWHLRPEGRRQVDPQPAANAATAIYSGADFRRRYPDGRIGSDQLLADPAIGAELLETATEALLERHREWLTELDA